MTVLTSPNFLRNVLWADAVSCAGCAALQLLLPGTLAGLLGLPYVLLLGTGAFLAVYAGIAAFAATRRPVPRGLVALFVAGNAAWGVGCLLLIGASPWALTMPGKAYLALQAITVFVLAEMQWFGLRRGAGTPA